MALDSTRAANAGQRTWALFFDRIGGGSDLVGPTDVMATLGSSSRAATLPDNGFS
jgi:hypothetical protein